MSLTIRAKLFVISVALVAMAALVSALALEYGLRSWLETRLENELSHYAQAAREAVALSPQAPDAGALEQLARHLAFATDTRVTLMAPGGVVLGDSAKSSGDLHDMDNHADRPEITLALSTGTGISQRYSTTTAQNMMYVALSAAWPGGGRGVVRVAMPMLEIEHLLERMHWLIAAAAGIGVLAAGFLSGLASAYASRTLRHLVNNAQVIAQGAQGGRLEIHTDDELGGLAGSFNTMADKLDRMVSTLAHERDRLAAILQSMDEAVVAIDADQRVTLLNQAACNLWQLRDAPLGKRLSDVVHNDALLELTKTSATVVREMEWPLPHPRRILARATPLQGNLGTVLLLHDITELRRLETIRRDFVANVSHELRTPVSIVRANAETLLDGALDDPPSARRFVEGILRHAERLGRIITDLLDISRIEAGQFRFEYEAIPTDQALRRVVEHMQVPAGQKQLQLSIRSDTPALAVRADIKALDHILHNLVENAVKYTPEGGCIELCADDTIDGVRFAVQDNGPGLDPHHRTRVFERFYRVDAGRSRDRGGTGLGLSIVKNLGEAMGGRVGVDTVTPHGSCFWIILPRAESTVRIFA